MKWNKKILLSVVLLVSLVSLSACQSITNWWKNTKEEWIGLEMTVRTFDENSQLIDEMSGKSLSISRNQETTVDIANYDRSIPLVNRMVSSLKNDFTGKAKVVLIRSQNGTPLATYVGDKVSLYASDAPKTSELLVDGKRLIIYRCDYTIYDRELLEN